MVASFIGLVVFMLGFIKLLTGNYEDIGVAATLVLIGMVVLSVGFLSIIFT
jgi:hypothetical protein